MAITLTTVQIVTVQIVPPELRKFAASTQKYRCLHAFLIHPLPPFYVSVLYNIRYAYTPVLQIIKKMHRYPFSYTPLTPSNRHSFPSLVTRLTAPFQLLHSSSSRQPTTRSQTHKPPPPQMPLTTPKTPITSHHHNTHLSARVFEKHGLTPKSTSKSPTHVKSPQKTAGNRNVTQFVR